MTCLASYGNERHHVNFQCLTCGTPPDRFICLPCVHNCHIGHELNMYHPLDEARLCSCIEDSKCIFNEINFPRDMPIFKINGKVMWGREAEEIVTREVLKAKSGRGKIKSNSDRNTVVKTDGYIIKTSFSNVADTEQFLDNCCLNMYDGNEANYHAYICLKCSREGQILCSQCIGNHVGHVVKYIGKRSIKRCDCTNFRCRCCGVPSCCTSEEGTKQQPLYYCNNCRQNACKYCIRRYHSGHDTECKGEEYFQCDDPRIDSARIQIHKVMKVPSSESGGTPNPYVVVEVIPGDCALDRPAMRTNVVEGDLNPVFEHVDVVRFVDSPNVQVAFKLFDKDSAASDDCIASLTVDISSLEYLHETPIEMEPVRGIVKPIIVISSILYNGTCLDTSLPSHPVGFNDNKPTAIGTLSDIVKKMSNSVDHDDGGEHMPRRSPDHNMSASRDHPVGDNLTYDDYIQSDEQNQGDTQYDEQDLPSAGGQNMGCSPSGEKSKGSLLAEEQHVDHSPADEQKTNDISADERGSDNPLAESQ